ncbi:MAG: site-specific DNA-methyltransferase [Candidatus Rokuibacteriota bacterium]
MPVLQFKGKTAIECYHHTVSHHTLEFDGKLSVLGKGEKPGLDGNLIIEGDNLLALKALLPTHAGRIKCIYIDPPYNTGNEGWVYNDNLTQPQFKEWIGQTVGKEGEDATRHDKWCCMMYPRLQLLKELLRDDGAIFISIDDNEIAHLRMLMDEIFGENNFIATIIWQKVYAPKSSAEFFSENHDYIVLYAKDSGEWERNLLPRTEKQDAAYSNPDNDPRGRWRPNNLAARNYYSRGTYSIKCPGGRVIAGPPPGSYWRVSEEKFWRLDREGRIWWGEDKKNVPAPKIYLSEVKKGIVPQTIWPYSEVGHTQDAKKTILQIFNTEQEVFLTPKPVQLCKRIIQLSTEPDDFVLDSFAGSGTTAHAVLDLNKEDEGDRTFILVQMPYDTKDNEKEKFNICRKITAERIRRVIQGYTFTKRGGNGSEKKEKVAGLGGSFSYARVGAPLFGEYRDLGKQFPDFAELAKYIFYTETSREFDRKAMNENTGKIGEHNGTSYYLLYTPSGKEDRALDMMWLKSADKTEKNRNLVVYCEKIWIHRDDLAKYEMDTRRTIRPMLVPFSFK